jgi:hypothetical protein
MGIGGGAFGMRLVVGHIVSRSATGAYSHLELGRREKIMSDDMHRDTVASRTRRLRDRRLNLAQDRRSVLIEAAIMGLGS